MSRQTVSVHHIPKEKEKLHLQEGIFSTKFFIDVFKYALNTNCIFLNRRSLNTLIKFKKCVTIKHKDSDDYFSISVENNRIVVKKIV